ncbi:hypothetical protein [Streptomyces sp. NPDC096193]|uniref:hypothetical protein n=1 Tax=Streptomyces sp. NPDC096193 TaxID=3155821 RepID=UPI00332D7A47
MAGGAEVGRDDQQQIVFAYEAEGRGVLLAGLRAGGGQQQEITPLERAADLSPAGSELLDDVLVGRRGHTVSILLNVSDGDDAEGSPWIADIWRRAAGWL